MLELWANNRVVPRRSGMSLQRLQDGSFVIPLYANVIYDAEELDSQVCRICHYMEQASKLIAPCRCGGFNKYLHEECFVSWVIHQVETRRITGNTLSSLRCELCNQKFRMKLHCQREYSCMVFKLNLVQKGFKCLLVFIVVLCISFGFATYVLIGNYKQNIVSALLFDNPTGKTLLLVTDLILFCILAILVGVFLHQNLVYIRVIIERVYNFYEPGESSRRSSSDDDTFPSQYYVVERKEQEVQSVS